MKTSKLTNKKNKTYISKINQNGPKTDTLQSQTYKKHK